jgi:acetyl-CoA carboxylase biotin carboxyl carrier protein
VITQDRKRKMRLSYLKKLIKLVEESDISTLEITKWGRSVRVEKVSSNSGGKIDSRTAHVRENSTITVPTVPDETRSHDLSPGDKSPAKPQTNYHSIKAPMVGTFYRAPSPDAPPYVELGQTVSKGQVLCIIEAMKLMNEIQSEVDGTIRKILVENAEPIEYGQDLFLVEP